MDYINVGDIIMDRFNDYLAEDEEFSNLLNKIKDSEVYDALEDKIIGKMWSELRNDIYDILKGVV